MGVGQGRDGIWLGLSVPPLLILLQPGIVEKHLTFAYLSVELLSWRWMTVLPEWH